MRKRLIGIFVALVLIALLVPVLPVGVQTLGPLHHVVITSTSATMAGGGTQQFTAQGQDANNVPIPNLIYVWALVGGGGLLSNTGLFTAGNITGTYTNTIQAIAVQGSIIKLAYASVTVTTAPQAKVCVHPGWCKGKKIGWHDDMPPGWSKGDKIGWQDCLHLSCFNRCDED